MFPDRETGAEILERYACDWKDCIYQHDKRNYVFNLWSFPAKKRFWTCRQLSGRNLTFCFNLSVIKFKGIPQCIRSNLKRQIFCYFMYFSFSVLLCCTRLWLSEVAVFNLYLLLTEWGNCLSPCCSGPPVLNIIVFNLCTNHDERCVFLTM